MEVKLIHSCCRFISISTFLPTYLPTYLSVQKLLQEQMQSLFAIMHDAATAAADVDVGRSQIKSWPKQSLLECKEKFSMTCTR